MSLFLLGGAVGLGLGIAGTLVVEALLIKAFGKFG